MGVCNSTSCISCRAGTYQPKAEGVFCEPCPAGKFSGAEASACDECPPGKYGTTPQSHTTQKSACSCEECPEGAFCYGNNTMAPKKGYWRAHYVSDFFFQCP